MRFFSKSGRMIAALAFLTLVPLVAHVLYSALGFNPAQDGAVLSAARRLLAGQVPHRDFIFLCPALSPLLHVPIVWLGGQQALWIARGFSWFQLAVIAWVWVALLNHWIKDFFSLPARLAAALVALVFSATTFPALAPHTLNGLCLATLGLALGLHTRPLLKAGGYFLCGCAVLCKPSFIIFAPLVLLTTGDWRHAKYWLAAALPGMAYVLLLSFTGALYDAVQQLGPGTTRNLLGHSWFNFSAYTLGRGRLKFSIYIVVGYLALRWIYGTPPFTLPPHRRRLQIALGWLAIGCFPLFLDLQAVFNGVLDEMTLNLFWTLAGAAVYFAMDADDRRRWFGWLAVWALALAWSVAVTPALPLMVSPAVAGGMLVVLLLGMSLAIIPSAWRTVILILLAGFSLFGFAAGRRIMVPQNTPALAAGGRRIQVAVPMPMITRLLDGRYPGAQWILSDTNTCQFTADLQEAVALAGQWSRPYAIIPDCPGYWAEADQPNPLPVDSLREIEYYNTNLIDRIMGSIEAQRPHLTILVQTVDANQLGVTNGVRKLRSYRNRIVSDIRNKNKGFKKIGETRFFELYE